MFRQVIRLCSTRSSSLDWSSIMNKAGTNETRAEVGRLRSLFEELSGSGSGSSKISNAGNEEKMLNWSKYEKELSKSSQDFVEKMKSLHMSRKFAKFDEGSVMKETEKFQGLVAQAEELSSKSKTRASELESMLKEMESKRTTKETTIDDVTNLYPNVLKEVEAEHKELDYGKSVL